MEDYLVKGLTVIEPLDTIAFIQTSSKSSIKNCYKF